MNLISIRFRRTADRTVLEFRHRLIGDDGRVSSEWGAWQIAYMMEDEQCKHMQRELPGCEARVASGTRFLCRDIGDNVAGYPHRNADAVGMADA
jgi:hypothetical protein